MTDFQTYVFAEVSVHTIRQDVIDYDIEVEDYPTLLGLSDEDLDAVLCWCHRKGFQIFNDSYGVDFQQLEQCAEWYYEKH